MFSEEIGKHVFGGAMSYVDTIPLFIKPLTLRNDINVFHTKYGSYFYFVSNIVISSSRMMNQPWNHVRILTYKGYTFFILDFVVSSNVSQSTISSSF
jgi:hypothetical protein